MNENPDKLHTLLHQWRELEPRGGFGTDVLRRIRLSEVEKPVSAPWWQWLHQPAWATLAVVIIGLSVGALGGWKSVPRNSNELQFLSPTTLAGAYLKAEGR